MINKTSFLAFLFTGSLMMSSCLLPQAAVSVEAPARATVTMPTKNVNNASATRAPDASMAPCISWINPLVKPRFALLCVHGLGLYSRAYTDFGMRISRRGAAVYAIDVRGFGSWTKAHGHQDVDFNACLQDIKTALQSIKRAHPDLPVFLLGESMGGAIALRAASMYPDLINGLISSVPAGDRFQQKRTDLKVALQLLRGPNKQFDIGKKIINQASTQTVVNAKTGKTEKIVNEKLVHDWEDDPLDRMDLSAKELIQFQRFMNDNYDSAQKINNLPVLFIQGIDDRLVRPDGTWDLFKQLATSNRTLIALPSLHLIFEHAQDVDPDVKQTAYRLVLGWIASQITEEHEDSLAEGSAARAETDPQLATAIQELVQAKYLPASQRLEALVSKNPSNADAHYWLGVAYAKLRRPMLARTQFRTAMKMAHDASAGRRANDYLLEMAETTPNAFGATDKAETAGDSSAVLPAPTGNQINEDHTSTRLPKEMISGITHGKPAVLAFYASWIEQCDKLQTVFSQAQGMFGDSVAFKKVDVTDSTNDDLVKALDVGPLPTIVFLKSDGSVSSTLIGQSSFVNVAQGIAKLLK